MGGANTNPEVAELVGLWSKGAGYYSTFSDEWLIFRSDGTGRLVFLNPYHDHSDHFRWRVVAYGLIDLIGTTQQEPKRDEQADEGNEFHFLGVRYRVAEVERPPGTGNWMRELSFDLAVPRKYGFESSDYEEAESRLHGG